MMCPATCDVHVKPVIFRTPNQPPLSFWLPNWECDSDCAGATSVSGVSSQRLSSPRRSSASSLAPPTSSREPLSASASTPSSASLRVAFESSACGSVVFSGCEGLVLWAVSCPCGDSSSRVVAVSVAPGTSSAALGLVSTARPSMSESGSCAAVVPLNLCQLFRLESLHQRRSNEWSARFTAYMTRTIDCIILPVRGSGGSCSSPAFDVGSGSVASEESTL
ncbi:uncharacterized protein B0H18DRAFT_630128 [Fomitopsis serialis]|uniref:uncharacterized protein n=1 Tax=Fomitopsis serialis TaxID=139415 RepID=UPI002007298D|nr:uncharacterized protein B0H18DRAFT_630128 [Neoantrodia serialis]KAH9919624.1 hypothetical protein B0H18DRAFT_630128 [Neoantrodia serialis]